MQIFRNANPAFRRFCVSDVLHIFIRDTIPTSIDGERGVGCFQNGQELDKVGITKSAYGRTSLMNDPYNYKLYHVTERINE